MKKLGDWQFKDWLAMVTTLGVISLLGVLQLKPIPETNKDIVNIALGALLGGMIARIAGHYFPSTQDPKAKTDPTKPE